MTETVNKVMKPKPVRLILVALLSGVAAALALQLIPATEHELGPTTVTARGELGRGETTVIVPPLGTVEADTHTSPLALSMTVAEVDPAELTEAVQTETGRRALADAVESGLRGTTARIAIQLLVGAAVVGTIIAALLPGRTWTYLLAGACGGAVTVGAFLVLTAATFDVSAFEEPRFTGTLQRAPEVIAAVDQRIKAFEELSSRYEQAATRLSDLLALVAEPVRAPDEGSVSILHVSDIHSNPIGVQIARQLAREFDVDAIVDTGDVTSFGASIEGRIAGLVEQIPVPYVFIPGNHDSIGNRAALAAADNVTMLTDDIVDVNGVEILGWADPTFTASNETSTEEANEIRSAEADDVAERVRNHLPDVLAVHDVRLAEQSVGDVPLVLAGHTHEADFQIEEGTTLMTVGSTGATGLGSFIVESDAEYEAEVLYFADGRAIAYDYITLSGVGGDFTVERRTLSAEE
jgi:predicted MPP superfamily phosphohydrolase